MKYYEKLRKQSKYSRTSNLNSKHDIKSNVYNKHVPA